MSFLPAQLQNFSLNGSGVSIGNTTLTLTSFKTIDGVNLSMADFGGTRGYMTIEPGSRGREEQISFSGITQNSNGTATLTGINTVLFLSPFTETSGFTKSHPGGVVAVVTNTSGFYNKYTAKPNNETITGLWNVPDPVTGTNIANRQWVLSVVNGGAVSVAATIVSGNAGETVSIGKIVYFKPADGLWYLASSAVTGTTDNIMLGVAQGAGTAANPITGGILIKGTDANQSGLTPGSIYYLSTLGGISASAGTVARAIGQAASATSLYFDPDFFYTPTALQKAAFAGNGGTPSGSNTYVTQTGLNTVLNGVIKFGGTGADGALSISSGTTNIDLGGVNFFTKNYTSVSITGTGAITFTNPHANGTVVTFKSQGAVTVTSSANPIFELRGIGASGGQSGNGFTSGPGAGSTSGITSAIQGIVGSGTHLASSTTMGRTINVFCGAGGGGASAGSGSGGPGGGGLYIECAGALNITGTINANGTVGNNGTTSGSVSHNWSGGGGASSGDGSNGTDAGSGTNNSGGGGGGGGSICILYGTLTANTGTYFVSGAAGGTGAAAGGTGADGYTLIAKNISFF